MLIQFLIKHTEIWCFVVKDPKGIEKKYPVLEKDLGEIKIAEGKTQREAEMVTEKEVIRELGDLPGDECHCAKLVLTTFYNTIK